VGRAPVNPGYLFCFIAVVSWGLAVIPIKHARRDPMAGLAIGLVAGLALVTLAWISFGTPHLPQMSGEDWWLLAAGGVFRFPVATYFYYQGIQRAGILYATPLGRLKPVFVCLIIASIGWETPSIGAFIGASLAFLGAFLLFPRKLPVAPDQPADRRRSGMIFAVLASLAWALGDIFLNQISGPGAALDPIGRTVLAIGVGTVSYWVMVAAGGKLRTVFLLPAKTKGWYALHGILSFGIGTLAMVAAFDTLPVSTVSILTSTWPLISVMAGYVLFSERVTPIQAAGLTLTLLAAAFVLM
jgi:drug/metabolite transporter (DMT)-like permease